MMASSRIALVVALVCLAAYCEARVPSLTRSKRGFLDDIFDSISEVIDDIQCAGKNDYGCKYWCRSHGQSGGECGDSGQCLCSGRPFREYICGGDELDEEDGNELCGRYCQFRKRKQGGKCDFEQKKCECVDEDLKLRHVKCVSDFACRWDCHMDGYQGGKCVGEYEWDCECEGERFREDEEDEDEPVA